MQLSPSQEIALKSLKEWYFGTKRFMILQGPAGSGKTTLVQEFLKSIPNIKPLITADTHQAVSIIKQATNNEWQYSTVCSMLGLVLSFEKEKSFLIKKSSPSLEDFSILIVDEASQLSEDKVDYIEELDIPVLFIGHESQLPPVIIGLSSNDLCISPVFKRGYPKINLKEQMRSSGELYEFCKQSESLIYERGVLDFDFQVDAKFLANYLINNVEKVKNGNCKFLTFSNRKSIEYNELIRSYIFNKNKYLDQFILSDKIIIRNVSYGFDRPLLAGRLKLDTFLKNTRCSIIQNNTEGEVLNVEYKQVLDLVCLQLYCKLNTFEGPEYKYLYFCDDEIAFKQLRGKLYNQALYDHNERTAQKKWEKYHNLKLLFADIRHSYSMTIHCSQGSTYDEVFVDDRNIDLCTNSTLKKKLRYVAYSRAKNNLFRLL